MYFRLSSTVFGLGINGKVVECYGSDGLKCALKVSFCYKYTFGRTDPNQRKAVQNSRILPCAT